MRKTLKFSYGSTHIAKSDVFYAFLKRSRSMKIGFSLLLFVMSCSVQQKTAADPNCVGTNGVTYSCGSATCSLTGGSGCSASINGVSCCATSTGNVGSPSTGSAGDGTNACALGYCWTNPENICCPISAQYACDGLCYTSNVCSYTSYRSACHEY